MKDLYIRPVKRGFLVRSSILNRDVALFTSLYEAQNFINNFAHQSKGLLNHNYDHQMGKNSAVPISYIDHSDYSQSSALTLPSNLPSAVKNYNNNYFIKRTNEGFLVSMRTNRGDSDIALFRTNDDALFFIKITANIASAVGQGNNNNNNFPNTNSSHSPYQLQNLLPSNEYSQNYNNSYSSQENYLGNSSNYHYSPQAEVPLGPNGVQQSGSNVGYVNHSQYVSSQPEVQLGPNGVQQPGSNVGYANHSQYVSSQPEVQLGPNGVQQSGSNVGYANHSQYVSSQPEVQLGPNGVQQSGSNVGYANQGQYSGQNGNQSNVVSNPGFYAQGVEEQPTVHKMQGSYDFAETVNFSDVNFLDSNEEAATSDAFEFDGDHVQSIFEKMMEEENYSKSQLKKMNREAEKKGKKDTNKSA